MTGHHGRVATRAPISPPPRLAIVQGDAHVDAVALSLAPGALFLRCRRESVVGEELTLQWTGPGAFMLEAAVTDVAQPAPDGRAGVHLQVRRVTSRAGEAPLRRFAARWLALAEPLALHRTGAAWVLELEPGSDEPTDIAGPSRIGGALAVSGLSATAAPTPPLDTGRPPTTLAALEAFFQSGDPLLRAGVYLNIPAAYWIAGAKYWGRANRLSDRWLSINTSVVVPGLGVRIRCDLTVDVDEHRRALSVYGVMSRRQDAPQGSTYRTKMMVRVTAIDEGESPGLLAAYLEKVAAEKRENVE